ncbi:helix-turn-helix domain-containing protein [Pseudomonas koreensis]|uniref:helix-turn-helix domain-containing protein n=1 Tax=Pseudomonas koreensis TaxID=198620 RepID=UPI00207797F1|nr:XRE family transcriptional regulator [Pseudomonas koreensis]
MISTNTISENSSLRSVIKLASMNTLGARIKKYRLALGMSQKALAMACGWGSQSRIGNYESDAREPTLDDVRTIADALRIAPEALLLDSEGSVQNVQMALQPTRAPKEYPLISWVIAGEWAESCDNFHPGDADMWIASTENAGEHGFWLDVRGDSMTCSGNPNFPEGSRILVLPEADLVSGKYYVVKLESGESTFKQYVEDAGVKYLRPLNPAYRTIQIDGPFKVIGRVIDTKMTGL